MRTFKATIEILGEEIEVINYTIEFSRKTDNKGRPCSPTLGGRFTFVTEAASSTFLAELMLNLGHKPVLGRMRFFHPKDNKTMRELAFKDAFVIFYKESCYINKNTPIRITCTLIARVVTIGNAYQDSGW